MTTEPDAARDAGVRRLMRSIGWSGIFGLQFLRTDAAEYVIDLNPRVYGSLALAVAAGHNLTVMWTDLLLGGRPCPDSYRRGVRYSRGGGRLPSTADHADRRGQAGSPARISPAPGHDACRLRVARSPTRGCVGAQARLEALPGRRGAVTYTDPAGVA